jgi:Raf kinase inhibitor-like YbhB/YbcL family protein
MRRKIIFIVILVFLLVFFASVVIFYLLGPTRGATFSSIVEIPSSEAGFSLTSPDFANGEPIPARYTCDGENIPPTLSWSDPPPGTKSLALVVDDPDAPVGTWTHWIVYNIPPDVRTMDQSFTPGIQISDVKILFGKNSWGKQAYGGPCPPSGTHRYVFQLFALDILLGPKDRMTKNDLSAQMQNHVLGFVQIMGTYTK